MDDTDLAILRTVQQAFPLSAHPYDVLARELGLPADAVHRRLSTLKRDGVIRRIGPLFSSRKLGLHGHLVAARVEPDAVDTVATLLEGHDEVTHNYLRSGQLNVWFTVVVHERDDLERILDEVRAVRGVTEVVTLATRKVFKLDASFTVGNNDG